MSNKKQQNISKQTQEKQAELAEKRAANLRSNLQKRKRQLRDRKES